MMIRTSHPASSNVRSKLLMSSASVAIAAVALAPQPARAQSLPPSGAFQGTTGGVTGNIAPSARSTNTLTIDAKADTSLALEGKLSHLAKVTINGGAGDTLSVTKSLTRQTWAGENFAGTYVGGFTGALSGCSTNGAAEEVDVLTVTQNGTSFGMTAANVQSALTCTYSGTYSQAGHLGAVSGGYQCTNGTNGSFSFQELEGTLAGLTGRVTTASAGCSFIGRFAGARRGS